MPATLQHVSLLKTIEERAMAQLILREREELRMLCLSTLATPDMLARIAELRSRHHGHYSPHSKTLFGRVSYQLEQIDLNSYVLTRTP